jgi:hypothetical protein
MQGLTACTPLLINSTLICSRSHIPLDVVGTAGAGVEVDGGGAGVPFMASDKEAASLGIAFWNADAISVSRDATPTLADPPELLGATRV